MACGIEWCGLTFCMMHTEQIRTTSKVCEQEIAEFWVVVEKCRKNSSGRLVDPYVKSSETD
jgi:hypothetical protein